MAPAQKSSAVPIVILLLVLLAAGGGAVWFFYLRPKAEDAAAKVPTPGSAAVVANPGSNAVGNPGSAGSDTQVGSAGTNVVEPPKGPIVDTVIASSTDKAQVEILGTDQKGPAPLTAKLEKDREYKARITAPGFAAVEVDIKGGQEKTTTKLAPKTRVITVNSQPAGALIIVDGSTTGHTTPHDVELTKAQAAKKTVRVTLRKSGFRQLDKMIAVDAYAEEDARMLAKLDEKLAVQQQVRQPPPDRGSAAGSAATGTGSATPPPDTSSGSGTTPTPGPGTGSAAKPPTPTPPAGTTPPAGAGSATKPPEPEPDFTKKP